MRKDEVGFGLMSLVFSQVFDDHSKDVVDDESDYCHEWGEEGC